MSAFTIRDLENLSGIKAHTIRIWEQRYSFLKPHRSETNIRYYDSEELKKLLNIALLNKYGFKISHIDKMDEETIREKIVGLTSEEAGLERKINYLLHGMIDLNPVQFEAILDQHISREGIDNTIRHLIFPFLERIGILWLTDRVRIAQEHIVSNIIRQKIINGIEKIQERRQNEQTDIVMFLPAGEHHELGLLYVYYLLRSMGKNIIYLGANVPVPEIEYICEIKHPSFIYSHLTSIPPRFKLENFFSEISFCMNGSQMLVSGQILQQYGKKKPANIRFAKSLDEVIETLGSNRVLV